MFQIIFLIITALNLIEPVIPMPCQQESAGCRPIVSENVNWFQESGLPGEGSNIVIYGHNRYDNDIFSDLPKIEIGDKLVLFYQNVYWFYTVENIFIVDNTIENGKFLNPTEEEQITLITCLEDKRLIVIAKLQKLPASVEK